MEWQQLLCKDRRRHSTLPGDHRDEFERDWDRAIFSTPVKRLQDKTQVFPLEPHDAVRTRLTHSLEVSAVARGLGIAVGKWLLEEKEISLGMERSIEAICATCGLIHDLGNPPFGHSGEDAIRYWFTTRFKDGDLKKLLGENEQLANDFLQFEGNAQTLRLLTKLQILADFYGLNLTCGTLSASCKYIATSNGTREDNQAFKKPGYFASESEVIAEIRAKTGTGEARNPLTYLVEAADDIVYSIADIEDAVKKGVLSWDEVREYLDGVDDNAIKEAMNRGEKILKGDNAGVPNGLPGDVHASAFRIGAIGTAVYAVVRSFKEHYEEIMSGQYKSELIIDCDAAKLVDHLRTLGRQRVYNTASNLKLELMGREIIGRLMDVFWEGASTLPTDNPPNAKTFSGKAGALLSENYRRVFQHWVTVQQKLPEKYHRLLLVTDHVCGMTDTFAKRLHAELTNG